MAGKFDDGDLHTKAYAQIGDVMLPGVPGRRDHPLDAAAPEAARDKDPVKVGEELLLRFLRDRFRVDPSDIHPCAKGKAGVVQRLRNGEIGVVKLHILPTRPMVTDLLRLLMAATMSRHWRRSGSGAGNRSSRHTTADRFACSR